MTAERLAPDVVAELRRRVAELRDAVAAGDVAHVEAIAHKLKGSALVLGLDALAVAASALEHAVVPVFDAEVAGRALGVAERELELLDAEARLRTLRHDLRNDVGVIVMAAGLLEDVLEDEALRKRAGSIVTAATSLAARLDEVRVASDTPPAPTPASPSHTPLREDGLTVLVVDDDALVRNLVAEVLSRAGVQVDAVGTLADARLLLDGRSYDAAIVDQRLDDGMGENLLPDLRDRTIRAVLYTGDPAAAAGGWDVALNKPAGPSELLAALGIG